MEPIDVFPGNNGSTVTGMILANRKKLTWNTKDGVRKANYWGSLTQASTVALGTDAEGHEVYVPMKDILPMVDPNDLTIDGWDISKMNLAESMRRAKVLDWDVQEQLYAEVDSERVDPSIDDLIKYVLWISISRIAEQPLT